MREEFSVGDSVLFKHRQHEMHVAGEVLEVNGGLILVRGLYPNDTWFLRDFLAPWGDGTASQSPEG